MRNEHLGKGFADVQNAELYISRWVIIQMINRQQKKLVHASWIAIHIDIIFIMNHQ